MYESGQKLSKIDIEVEVHLDDGSRFLGVMSLSQGQRVSDLMNDERNFIPVQLPGGKGTSSGGQAEFVPPLARAAVAVGVAAVFVETHEEPARSPSDGPNMVPLDEMDALLTKLTAIDRVAKDLT